MAIHKKFIHFKTFANFNSQKLSANEQDTQYTLGINGEIQNGSPTILYNSICYIKDTKQQWTHGQLYDCSTLTKPANYQIWYTTTDASVIEFADTLFDNNQLLSNVYENGRGVITFDRDITRIPEEVFNGKNNLKTIIIPDSVTSIGSFAFQSCTSLTSVTIPDSVTTIGEWAFDGCDSLTSVTIGNGVTTIGDDAFNNCPNLTSVYCNAIIPPGFPVDTPPFDTDTNLKIYVPIESLETYKNVEGWDVYYDKICSLLDSNSVKTINGESIVGNGDIVVGGGKEPFYFTVNNIESLTMSCFEFSNLIEAHKLGRPIFLRYNVDDYNLPEGLADLYYNKVIPVSVVYNNSEIQMSFIYAEKLYHIIFIVSDIGEYCSDEQSATIIPIDSIYIKPNGGIPKTDLSSDVQALLDDSNIVFLNVPLNNPDFEEDGFGNLDIGLIQFTLQEDYNTLKQAVIDGKQLAISYAITSDISTPTYLYDLWIDDMIYGKIAHPYTGMIYDVEIFLGGISFSKVAKVTSNGIAAKDLYFEENNNSSISIKEALSRKQDKLTSGTNIKTINGTSILGSGDITISGGSGTITEVKANGTSITTNGVANIPAASTSAYGVAKLSSATNSTSTTLAATASAVKAAYDLANSYKGTVTSVKINGTTKSPSSGVVDLGTVITAHQDISGKQDTLVSGTNIKTINGTSILGSGDITISGSGSSSSSVAAYRVIEHGTNDTTTMISPNAFHVWGEVPSLTIIFGGGPAAYANEYLFQFTSGSTATTLSLPDDIKWANELVVEPNMIYQVSVLRGLASVLSWNNVSIISFTINLDYTISTYNAEDGMTWEEWVYSKYNTVGFQIIDGAIIDRNQSYWVTADVGSSSLVSLSAVISAEHEYGTFKTGGGGAGN